MSVERILVCNVIEKLAGHTIHCLPCIYTNDVIYLFPQPLRIHINILVISSSYNSAKVLSTAIGNSVIVAVTDIWRHVTYDSREA